MKRFLCVVMIFMPLLLCAQKESGKKPVGLRRLEVSVSDNPMQGGRLEVTYLIEALDMNIAHPPVADGGTLVDVSASELKMKGRYYIREFTFVYDVHCNGNMKIAPLDIQIFDKMVSTRELSVNVAPHPEYGQEWAIARNHLHQLCGYNGSGLKYRYGTSTYRAFYDQDAKVFAIVVDNDYQQYISWPILAYGEGNRMWDGKDASNTVASILDRYDTQLKYLKMHYSGSPMPLMPSSGISPQGVRPLLGDIEYDQDFPYNQAFMRMHHEGTDSLCLAGCGAVTLAQILAMNRSQPSGKARYRLKDVWEGEADLDDYHIDWENMQLRDTASLIFAASASLGSEMSPAHTASSMRNFKPALICNWGYSPRAKYIKDSNDSELIETVYEELDSGRPVVVSGSSHIFVCDGYDQDFLHYNFGWEGDCNGWYRAIVIPSMSEKQLPFTSMIAGISPMDPPSGTYREVSLAREGRLAQALSEEEKAGLMSLKVNGNINGDDIALLRQMCGGAAPDGSSGWTGSLMTLDLSDANIVSGGVYFTETIDTQMQFSASNDVLGQFMFIDCHNLRSIMLPRTVRFVDDYAFFGCSSLQHIDLGGAANNVCLTAFRECDRLETRIPEL